MKASDQVKRAALNKTVNYLLEDPERNITKIMDMLDKVAPTDLFPSQRIAFRNAIERKNNWYELLMRVLDLNPTVRNDLIRMFLVDANLMAWPEQEANREKYQCNIPWALLMDPTSACNLHCTGCWAAEYGSKQNLTLDEMDSVIRQAKELGTHVFIYTGGEPLVRKRDVIALCEQHPDCAFLSFTNADPHRRGLLPGHAAREELLPAISVEGFEEATDARRGDGTYGKVVAAMRLLKRHGLPFGRFVLLHEPKCHVDRIRRILRLDDRAGARCSAGSSPTCPSASTLPPTSWPRPSSARRCTISCAACATRSRCSRSTSGTMASSWAAAIAGGRRYLHINAAGDVEPCVFAHYANANIRDVSLWTRLRSPIFMAYYEQQPFNYNYLRPCPTLDNAGILADMVDRAGAHSTDLQHAEDAHDLCASALPPPQNGRPLPSGCGPTPTTPLYQKRQDPGQGLATPTSRSSRGWAADTSHSPRRSRKSTQRKAALRPPDAEARRDRRLLLFCLLFASTGPPKVSEKRSRAEDCRERIAKRTLVREQSLERQDSVRERFAASSSSGGRQTAGTLERAQVHFLEPGGR